MSHRAAFFLLTTCVAAGPASAQGTPKGQKPLPAPALLLAPLSGQPIPVLPLTYIVSDSGIAGLPAARVAQLAWVDSVLAEVLQARGPEATWVFPPELRRVAKRGAGVVGNPDRMTQAVMRFSNVTKVPDPLLSNLRGLIAMTNSRYVMIPAMFRITRSPEGVKVEATLVLVDARSGAIPWRSSPVATAPTAAAALAATIAHILPDDH
ncbi:MAG: hypothetical protein ABUL71_00890 [Gemmatimonadota bacterium]